MASNVEYLGHAISQAGLDPAPCKVDAVLKALKPQHKKELQSYLGLIGRKLLQEFPVKIAVASTAIF